MAISLLLTHLFGDAFASAILGALSDLFGSLQQALLIAPFAVLGAAAVAFVGSRWVGRDRKNVLVEAGLESS